MAGFKMWTGANDIENEGQWIWTSDNTTLQYARWNPEQPDNFNREEHCVVIYYDGGWNDIVCSERLIFTCEKNVNL